MAKLRKKWQIHEHTSFQEHSLFFFPPLMLQFVEDVMSCFSLGN